jgi:hypothetical protein
MEDQCGFRNFTRMGALDFELLVTIIGFKCPESVRVHTITFTSFFVFLGLLIPTKNVKL